MTIIVISVLYRASNNRRASARIGVQVAAHQVFFNGRHLVSHDIAQRLGELDIVPFAACVRAEPEPLRQAERERDAGGAGGKKIEFVAVINK